MTLAKREGGVAREAGGGDHYGGGRTALGGFGYRERRNGLSCFVRDG